MQFSIAFILSALTQQSTTNVAITYWFEWCQRIRKQFSCILFQYVGVRATVFSDAMSFLQMQKFQVFTKTRVLLSWHKNTTCDNHLVVRCNAENNTINCCNLQYNIVFFSSVYLITSVSYTCDHIAAMQNSHWIAKLPTFGYKSAILCIFLAKVHTILIWLRNNHWSLPFCC